MNTTTKAATPKATATFRRQHDEILSMAKGIAGALDPKALKEDAKSMRDKLSKLAGVLTVHLSMEDRSLYPMLVKHGDPSISSLAGRYMKEMGGLKEAFVSFVKRWSVVGAIEAAPETFIAETRGVFDALGKRVDRENNELYVIVDRVGI
jgi:hypothetical protein